MKTFALNTLLTPLQKLFLRFVTLNNFIFIVTEFPLDVPGFYCTCTIPVNRNGSCACRSAGNKMKIFCSPCSNWISEYPKGCRKNS